MNKDGGPLNLTELLEQLYNIEKSIVENGGELPAETEQTFDLAKTGLGEKVDQYAFIIDRSKHLEAAYKAQADEFSKSAKSFKKLRERLQDNLKHASLTYGTELLGNDWRFTVSPSQPSLKVECLPEQLPEEYTYLKTTREIDTDKLKQDLLAGVEIPGASLEQGLTLRKYPKRKELK